MGIEKYTTKESIAIVVQMFDSSFTSAQISNVLMKMINALIDQWIIEHGLRPKNINDRFNLLWTAAICMGLELLCNTRQVSWSTGDVALEKLNRVTYGYQRWQPMFFFATGSSRPFEGLLPHATYRMMAYSLVRAYCDDDFFKKYGSQRAIPVLTVDQTSRGFGWNTDEGFVTAEDMDSRVWDDDTSDDDTAEILYFGSKY